MIPKYKIGEKFSYVDNVSTVYIEIIGVAPEVNSENEITYFTKTEYVYDDIKKVYFEAEEEKYLDDYRFLYS